MTIESLDNVELSESVVSKKSLRVVNTNKKTGILDVELVYLKVPDNLTHWISTSDGLKLIEKVKNKKSLIDLEIIQEDGTASLKLIGLKNNIDSASLFLKFNFDNLDHVGKLKIRKSEMQTDLKKKEEF